MKRLIILFNGTPEDFKKAKGLSGGDRILFECLKVWVKTHPEIRPELVTCPSGKERVAQYAPEIMDHLIFHIVPVPPWMYGFLPILFPWKTLRAMGLLSKLALGDGVTVFSSSDLFPDSLPGWWAKRQVKSIRWVSAFFFTAASPFSKSFPYQGAVARLRGILYYYSQRFCFHRIRRRADHVAACNEIDRRLFLNDGHPGDRVTTLYGGVHLTEAEAVPSLEPRPMQAVFMARFHPQKAPVHAVWIWAEVVKVLPEAKLVMIGNGPEEFQVRKAIAELGLEKAVTMAGFMDGRAKYQVFKSSRIFLMPSTYETGTMAAVEGMAAGLPVLAYDQEGYRHAYREGLIAGAPIGDFKALAPVVVEYLQDDALRSTASAAALREAARWAWPVRSEWLWADLEGKPRKN